PSPDPCPTRRSADLFRMDGDLIRRLPAHPHEGAVGAPADEPSARVIATGLSKATGKRFNIAVAFEPGPGGGPAIAQSTFHHFAEDRKSTRLNSSHVK